MTSSDHWRRLEEVFEAALDIPTEQREAWLNTACAGDAELRREVEDLLRGNPDESPLISGIIEGAAANLFDDSPRDDVLPDAMAGQELGNYKIIRELGRGGMGAVYLAVRSDRAFEKQVAIKLVKRGIDTDAVLQRFWYERRILAALEHPYIARLIDGGTSPDGRPYFVMEYVDGKPLDVYAREEALSTSERCELFRKICEAVSYAHRNLIIHRDLKPANILVTADGTPKLLDFGIARLLSVDPGEHTIAGPANSRALTPEFASPEQKRGDAVSTATDVYSLGVTLKAILPAGSRIPADLATIIHKATREESDQRFASVADLSEDLRRYLAGLPITAREQTVIYQVSKFVRRHRLGVAVFAVANLLAIAGVAAIVWESRQSAKHRKEAELRLSQAVEMAERALTDVNNSIANLPGTTEARRKLVHDTLEYLDRLSKDSGENPRVLTALATAYIRVGEVLGNSDTPNLGELPGALATYQKALGVIKGLLEKEPDDLKIRDLAAAAHGGAGNVLGSLGREKDAEGEYRAEIALADSTLARYPTRMESQYRSLEAHFASAMLLYVPRLDATLQDLQEHLPMAVNVAAANPDNMAMQELLSEYYSTIGTCVSRQNRQLESLPFYHKAVEVREAICSKNPRNTRYQRTLMMGYGHLGDILGNPSIGCIGDYREALVYYMKAERIIEEMSVADASDKRASFDMGMIWQRIGAARRGAGDLAFSNQALDRSIAQFEALLSRSPGNADFAHGVMQAYEYRGRNTWDLGDLSSAMTWYRKSLAITDRLIAEKHMDLIVQSHRAAALGEVSNLLAIAGDRTGALKTADEAIALAQDNVAHGGTHAVPAMVWFWYGQTLEVLHDLQGAAAAYGKSAEAWKAKPNLTGLYAARLRESERRAALCSAGIVRPPSRNP